ncbi:MAG: hypothetical protein CMM50_17040 [Rhodospirillaceae bacterium]|jgi:hypothetical protein|nr:hypothetical protein [Rhodospirillaceae bacterium]|tara:strand:+ start:3297 stop:3605 length:309 start_codon:yes stop_codon:yes gene_type:complete
MADTDLLILEDASDAAFTLDKAYRKAVLANDLDTMVELKPQVDAVYDTYSLMRLKLLEEGVVTTAADVAEMRRLKGEIDQAAETQQLVAGAIALISFLRKFV